MNISLQELESLIYQCNRLVLAVAVNPNGGKGMALKYLYINIMIPKQEVLIILVASEDMPLQKIFHFKENIQLHTSMVTIES